MNKEEREQLRKDWEARIADFKSSGQSAKEWCNANNIKPSKLHYWLRKFKSDEQSSGSSQWLPVEVDDTHSNGHAVVIKIGKAAVEIKPGYDRELLFDVLRTLSALC